MQTKPSRAVARKLAERQAYEQAMARKASPGSFLAVGRGCTCPVLDNAHGRGYMGREGVFVMTEGCPLHGTEGDVK